jgi:hypothetical protein
MNICLNSLSVDHIDPTSSDYVCGLNQPNNLRLIDLELNKYKSNAFVPYRLKNSCSAPSEEGNMCWFLVKEEWVWIPFCGEQWWEEAAKIGYSRTNRRGSSWYTNQLVSKMILPSEPIPEGFVKGRIYTGWSVKNLESAIKGKKRAYNPNTGEDGFFESIPPGYTEGISPSKRNPGKPKKVCLVWKTEVCDWYELGFTTRQIAYILGVTATTINKILKENHVPLRPTGGKRGKDLKPRKTDGYHKK